MMTGNKNFLDISNQFGRYFRSIVTCKHFRLHHNKPHFETFFISFFVSRFLLIKKTPKKSFFYPRAKKKSLSPCACEPARAQTRTRTNPIKLGTRRLGFYVTSSWQYAFLIGPFVSHNINTWFWLIFILLAQTL